MNKQLLIVILAVVAAGLGGFFYLSNSKKASLPSSEKGSTSGNVFTSIKDALSKSISLQCNFTDETGRKTLSYIKNGAVRADIEAQNPQESGSVIVKDKKMYFWNKTQAVMMDLSSVEEADAPEDSSNKTERQDEDLLNSLEQYKSSCKPAVVSDSLFTPPANIKFQDFSEILPSIDQSQYQKYLKQITQPASEDQE